MKKWHEIANKCFIDKFDLPLHEDTSDSFYTLDEIKQEVNKRITKLATLGAAYNIPLEYIAEYEVTNEIEAIAAVEPVGNHKYRFTISKSVTRKRNEKYLDAIIYHELCHVLQVEALVAMNVLAFIDGVLYYNPEERDTASNLYDKADGHTALWYMYVNYINRAFIVNPPIARFLNITEARDISDIFLEDTFAKKDWIPVERKVFIDDFSALLKDTETD